MFIISGMMEGDSGVGRLLRYLSSESASKGAVETLTVIPGYIDTSIKRAVVERNWLRFFRLLLASVKGLICLYLVLVKRTVINTSEQIVLLHPQTLGHFWLSIFMRRRREPVWLFLLDSSYFCLRSYNHLPRESQACLCCLKCKWEGASKHGCLPGPFPNFGANKTVRSIHRWVTDGKLKLLTQNKLQAKLAREHFGERVIVKVVGLRTVDFPPSIDRNTSDISIDERSYDVVFHGAPVAAKGIYWALQVACRCSSLSFLFPCRKDIVDKDIVARLPENIFFEEISWENGLKDEVCKAKVVLVPSVWSAPIEGALIKSLVTARAVAVVSEPTAYSSELPDSIVVHLPVDLDLAAKGLSEMIEKRWHPDELVLDRWYNEFTDQNHSWINSLARQTRDSGG